MKIAVSSTSKDMESQLDPRFGRASYFIIMDLETMAFEVVENSQNLNLPQGAGIQAAKTIVDNRADVLFTGHCGPKAFRVLDAAGIKIYLGAEGTVEAAVEKLQAGEYKVATRPDVEGHW